MPLHWASNVSTSNMTKQGALISKCAKHVQDRRVTSAYPFHAQINEHARVHTTLGREKSYVKSSFETTKSSNTTNDFSPISKLSSSIWSRYVFWCYGLWARKMFSIGSTRISRPLFFQLNNPCCSAIRGLKKTFAKIQWAVFRFIVTCI